MSLWEDYRDDSYAPDERKFNREYRINSFRRELERKTNVRMSKPFTAQYGGQFCVICGYDVEKGDEVLFLEDELAHAEEAIEKYGVKPKETEFFTFDPDDFK